MWLSLSLGPTRDRASFPMLGHPDGSAMTILTLDIFVSGPRNIHCTTLMVGLSYPDPVHTQADKMCMYCVCTGTQIPQ